MTSLRLYGIATVNGDVHALPPDTEIVAFKEVAAIVAPASYARITPDERAIAEHHAVIQQVFAFHAILPAPVGVIFRTRESLARWLELHYFTLSDGLAFVEGRCVARVRVVDTHGRDEDEARTLGSEMFKELRREAASGLPLKHDGDAPEDELLHATYLIERSRWDHFKTRALGERERHRGVEVTITGPWPPYDFVRLQLSR